MGRSRLANILAVAGVLTCLVSVSLATRTLEERDTVDVLVNLGEFKTLTRILVKADRIESWKQEKLRTYFAPTDEALSILTPPQLEKLFKNKRLMQRLVDSWVVDGKQATKTFTGKKVATVGGGSVVLALLPAPRIDQNPIVLPDIETSNGLVHAVSKVTLSAETLKLLK
ncbi:MAG TPA: fasciclin domain-containing protein [Fimbriimonas sp.]|nr:fasciclin domain-containing protein [Fimbriimonas sp.]